MKVATDKHVLQLLVCYNVMADKVRSSRFPEHRGPRNAGLVAIQPPDAIVSPRIFDCSVIFYVVYMVHCDTTVTVRTN
jgi:hypothetical protein